MGSAAFIFANERHLAPREDALAWDDDIRVFVAADGVTRDWDAIRQGDASYPDPSPATAAADLVAETALRNALRDGPHSGCLVTTTPDVRAMNERLGLWGNCDYLERDFAGAVAAMAVVDGNALFVTWIGDCGVAVIRDGRLVYLTRDQLDSVTAYLKENPAPFDDARRVYIRRDLRNKPNFCPDGSDVTYGVITGEAQAILYFESDVFELEPGDVVATHTDGFRPYFALPEFLALLSQGQDAWERELPQFTMDLAARDAEFGRERSILLYQHIRSKTMNPGPVVDTSQSPHAKLTQVSPASVSLSDPFWEPRMAMNRTNTLYGQYDQIEKTGRLDNFRRASGKRTDLDFQGIYFNDSDVYKWLEGAVWSLATHPDPELAKMAETAITEITAAQGADGYLDTYYMFDKAGERWSDLKEKHEMYCAGHFIQSAVANLRATGDDRLLHVAVKLADHICDTFGPDKRAGACGHQEIEMAMVELYRATGDERYLRQAEFFIDVRGRKPAVLGGSAYVQDHAPYASLDENVGHAVRMLYMNAGAADIVLETGDPALLAAQKRLWDDLTQRKMYITGGTGARHEGEAFGDAYELPSRAYAETCASIALVMWAARLLALTADAKYADVLERALYNGVLSGLSLTGDSYFYENPLADRGKHRRSEWFGCACCPPNIARLLAELPGYAFSTSADGLYVNLYAAGTLETEVAGHLISMQTRTQYPWDGAVEMKLALGAPALFGLHLRIPDWCEGASLVVNGEPVGNPAPGRYAEVSRTWSDGDTVALYLPMAVRAWEAHPHVESAIGRMAITRGPLVYCLEAADNPGIDVWDVIVPQDAKWEATFEADLLGGVVKLTTNALVQDVGSWSGKLYARPSGKLPGNSAIVKAIPYYAWANREAGPMSVWVTAQRARH